MKKVRDAIFVIALIFMGVSFLSVFSGQALAANGINKEISFEGKIVNNSGVNIADSTHYNMEFNIYTGCTNNTGTGCSTNWTEDYAYNGTTGGVSFSGGTFQVNLGSITSMASIPWGTNPLYLSIDIGNTSSCTPAGNFDGNCGGDTPMKPYVLLTATPYAFNADELGGVAASGYVQLTPSLGQTLQASTDVTGLTVKGSGAGTTSDIFDVQTSGSSSIIQTTGAGALSLTAQGTTQTLSVKTTDSTTASTGAITIQSGNASSGSNLSAGTVTIDTGTQTGIGTAALNIGASHALAIGIGNASSTTTFAGAITTGNGLFTIGTGGVAIKGSSTITAYSVPATDQLAITNAGFPVTAAGVNGLSINYKGGAAAVESAAERIDIAPGTLTGGTWSGIRVVPNATGAVNGVTEYGIKIDNLTTAGAGSETGMYIGTGWDTGLNVASGGLILGGYTSGGSPADPPAPSSGNLAVYSKSVSGRMLLKMKGPSGLDSPLQPALFGNNYVLFAPTSGATGTGSGFGTAWQTNGTVSHPTETTTNTGSQMHRTRYANVVTTTNQVLGPKINTADGDQFWTGNAAGLGGFFYETRFIVELYPATTVRLFAGLASGTTAVVASDTVAGDVVGLWHDTTDGANVLSLVTRNNVTTTKTNIPGATLTAGDAYDFYMFMKPDDTTVYYRLDDITLGTTVVDTSVSVTMPRNTIFMGPQVEMSNGTANITVTTVGIGVNRIYVESDH